MIIKTAAFKNLHGHLNPKLDFTTGVNIIIGVNGSGKTAVLNAMAWILSPSSVQGGVPAAYLLSNLNFDEIEICYTVPDRETPHKLTATRTEEHVVIAMEGIQDALTVPIIDTSETPWHVASRSSDEIADYIGRILEDQQSNPVLRHLKDLPGPLYLPLDRRWIEERESLSGRRTRRSTTAGHIPTSDVLERAARAHRRERAETFNRNEALRNDILTTMFDATESQASRHVLTLSEVNGLRRRVSTALKNLELNEALEKTGDVFDRLEGFAKELGGIPWPENVLRDPKSDRWLDWMVRVSPHAARLQRLMPIIEEYETELVKITKRTTDFLKSVNSFLSDNGKRVDFLPESDLVVELPDGQIISSHNLSSGELQLLILFTFLCFSFDAPSQAFPVLVDEPELSLHVAWQKRYVSSISEANPNAQFIIATHSPEIAGPTAESAITDITPDFRRKNAELQ